MMTKKLVKTWYRSLLTQGLEIWCESSDPEEVLRMSEEKNVIFQKMEHYIVTNGWEHWDGI